MAPRKRDGRSATLIPIRSRRFSRKRTELVRGIGSMALPIGSIGFGFLAGILSTLSPCVLPLLPLVLGPAVAVPPLGVPAFAARPVTSFLSLGLFVATGGFS